MASLSFTTLLKTRDCLHKYHVCSVLYTHGFVSRSFRARLSKRSFCSRFRAASSSSSSSRHVWAKQPQPKSYASVMYASSASSEDITKGLWAVYNDTKKKTEGMHTHGVTPTCRPALHAC